jgi:nucleoside phosphorylase
MPRAVILTALPVEHLAVRAHLTDIREEIHPESTVYERGGFVDTEGQGWEVGIVDIRPGNVGAALETERAIAYFRPEVVLFVGVAGGIKDVAIGDVVASTKIYGYESGKAEQRFKPRPEIGLPAYSLEQRARAEARKGDWLQRLTTVPESLPRVFVAPIAAGEKVIASTKSEIFEFLCENYGDAIAVEMEGFGVLEAVRANQRVSAIVIRGISDLIDVKENSDKNGSQEIASRHASAFAFTMLANLNLADEAGLNDVQKSPQPPEIPNNINLYGTPHFVGRITEIERLHVMLQQESRVAVTAIQGMGGVGKTELALQYALLHIRDANYPGGVCWLRARSGDIGMQIASFGQTQLGLRIPEDLKLLEDRVAYCWRHWREGEVLIVIDNVVEYETIQRYLPPTGYGRFKVLLTTRLELGSGMQRLPLDMLEPEAALALLQELVGAARIEDALAKAKELCEWLGYLPLGIELVGCYLSHNQTLTLVAMQERLNDRRLAAQALERQDAGMTTPHKSLKAAFEMSWEDLQNEAIFSTSVRDDGQRLGMLLSLFAVAPIPWTLVVQCLRDQGKRI